MISQILFECKKVVRSKWLWLAFIGVIAISISLSLSSFNVREYYGINDEGEALSGSDAYWEVQDIAKEYEGVMDEGWLAKFDQDLKIEQRKDMERLADYEKMKATYGEVWQDLYLQDPDAFINEKYWTDDDRGSAQILYENENYAGETLRLSFLESLDRNYVYIIRNRQWKNVNIEVENDTLYQYAKRDIEKSEDIFIQAKMSEIPSFSYASGDGWQLVLNIMAGAYFFLPMFIVLLLANMFNKERSYQMVDLIRTSSFGKRKVASSKIIASILLSIGVVLIFITFITLYVYVTKGLASPDALVSLTTNAVSPFTYRDAFINGIILYVIGGVVVGLTSSFLSCLCKSSYVSLGIASLIFVLPNIIPSPFVKLFPIQFLELTSVVVNPGLFSFGNTFYYLKDCIWIWIIPIILATIVMYIYYKTYRYNQD